MTQNNPVNTFLEYVQQTHACTQPTIFYSMSGSAHAPTFTASVKCQHNVRGALDTKGVGATKAAAKNNAFQSLCRLCEIGPFAPKAVSSPKFARPSGEKETQSANNAALERLMLQMALGTALDLTLGAITAALSFQTYKQALIDADAGFIRWVCCKCDFANGYAIEDDDSHVCPVCGTDVSNHIAASNCERSTLWIGT